MLFALLLAALLLRAGVLWKYSDRLGVDRDNYRGIARELAAGKGFTDPRTQSPTAYRPPLYPILLAAVLYCGGHDFAIAAVQLALSLGTVALTIASGRRLGLGRASLAAGGLAAVDPLLVFQSALVMTETTAAFLAALLLWACMGSPSQRRSLGIGIIFGLCCLCRPTFWAFGALAGGVWVLTRLRGRGSAESLAPNRWKHAAILAAGLVLIVAPWAIRNALVLGRPIVTTTHGGYTLLLAHNPAYTHAVVDRAWNGVWKGDEFEQWAASLESEMAREIPAAGAPHSGPAVEVVRDDWMNRKAWKYIRTEPATAVKAGITLLLRMWSLSPRAVGEAPISTATRIAIGVFNVVVLLSMLAGVVRLSRSNGRQWWPPVALILAFTAVHALYWADMRMRTPLVPAIALLAAAGWRPVVRLSR